MWVKILAFINCFYKKIIRTPIDIISGIEISQCLFYGGFDFKIELGWPPVDFYPSTC